MNLVDCPFCNLDQDRIVKESRLFNADFDLFHVTKLHLLLIPKEHVGSYFDLSEEHKTELVGLLDDCKEFLEQKDEKIEGFNVGINDGETAGQTIMHCHIHLIPRRRGDNPNPRGGVRGVIPEKQSY